MRIFLESQKKKNCQNLFQNFFNEEESPLRFGFSKILSLTILSVGSKQKNETKILLGNFFQNFISFSLEKILFRFALVKKFSDILNKFSGHQSFTFDMMKLN